MKCPCSECLVFAMCQNRDILYVIRGCEVAKNYLHESAQVLNKERLEEVCSIFGRTLKKGGGGYRII